MSWKTTRAFSAALLMGAAVLATETLVSSDPVHAGAAPAAPRITTENRALAEAIQGAQADARAGRYADALAKAKAAEAIPGKPPELARALNQMIVSYAISARNYAAALEHVEKMIATNQGNRVENLKQALSLAIMMRNRDKANQYADQLGSNLDNNTRLYIASQMADAGQYREALAYAAPAIDVPNPSEAALRFKQAVAFRMNDQATRRQALEQLVTNYPKPEYWRDLLQLARNQRGLNDEQRLDIFRLRLAVGDLKTDADYQEMAQQALVAGYPAEAKAALDKANELKLLQGERAGRLMRMTEESVKTDLAGQAELASKAATDPNIALKLANTYRTFGKYEEAEKLIRAAIASRRLADPEAAKVALGHVLLAQGKRQEAMAAYNSVARNSSHASIARLWSIYARRA